MQHSYRYEDDSLQLFYEIRGQKLRFNSSNEYFGPTMSIQLRPTILLMKEFLRMISFLQRKVLSQSSIQILLVPFLAPDGD